MLCLGFHLHSDKNWPVGSCDAGGGGALLGPKGGGSEPMALSSICMICVQKSVLSPVTAQGVSDL